MPYVSKEQLTAAREVDLLTYLRCFEPQELVHISGSTYVTRTHDSLKISNGKWFWWSRGIGGRNALDYLTAVEGLWLPEAVQRILGESPCIPPPSKPAVLYPKTEFMLPPKHTDNRRVFAYLRSRGIDAEIINHCIKHGQLYEDAVRHNCIFVGFAEGKPAYAMLRGTQREKRFVGEAAGSDKRFTFAVPLAPSNGSTLCDFEGAIDALSYLTLLKQQGSDWRKANTLALGGISGKGLQRLPPALTQYLKAAPIYPASCCAWTMMNRDGWRQRHCRSCWQDMRSSTSRHCGAKTTMTCCSIGTAPGTAQSADFFFRRSNAGRGA